ncbi:hypothetical protein ACJX0J_023663, partial [Zea mays]
MSRKYFLTFVWVYILIITLWIKLGEAPTSGGDFETAVIESITSAGGIYKGTTAFALTHTSIRALLALEKIFIKPCLFYTNFICHKKNPFMYMDLDYRCSITGYAVEEAIWLHGFLGDLMLYLLAAVCKQILLAVPAGHNYKLYCLLQPWLR